MGVRIGVDVGGTFTKAVGIDTASGAVTARASVLTTHEDRAGSAAGVVAVVSQVATAVGADQVELITYSTTQAVNALLEGDVAVVGVLGMGRQPDLRKAAKRTRLDKIELSPGRRLPTVIEFLDITHGLADATLGATLDRLQAGGATTICVAEAFAPDGGTAERRGVQVARPRAAGLRVLGHDRALRARAEGGDGRPQRVRAPDRSAHRGARRGRRGGGGHRRSGDGDARRWRGYRSGRPTS